MNLHLVYYPYLEGRNRRRVVGGLFDGGFI